MLLSLRKVLLLVVGSYLALPATHALAEAVVSICGESWPPYVYETGDKNNAKKNMIEGIHVQNFKTISELTGLEFDFEILPWKRCLNDVEKHTRSTDPEIAIDASHSKERAEKYHFVGPIYAFGTALFYSREKHPKGPYSERFGRRVTMIADMRDFEICGFLGWNYESYYTKHRIPRSVKIFKSRSGMQSSFDMLSHDRCEVLEVHPQIVIGAVATGKLKLPRGITCHKLSGDLQKFFLMVSKNSPRAMDLVSRLGKAIKQLQDSGRWMSVDAFGSRAEPETREIMKCL
jgi:polar amino acid transport system substrate-binding protein